MKRILAATALTALLGAGFTFAPAAIAPAFAHDFTKGDITINHPWSRPTAHGQANGAAYFELSSAGSADRLVAASTPVAAMAELHTHIHDNGVMRMRPVEGGIPFSPGAPAKLAPGGLHVMLMGLKGPLKPGFEFPLTLTFEKVGEITVEVKVADNPGSKDGGMHKPD